jgi:ATP-dependent DNA ligase
VRAKAGRPPAGPDRQHAVKRDAWRMLAVQASEWVQLWTRRGVDFADSVLKDWEGVRGLNADEALIGREAVVLREDGRRDFDASRPNAASCKPSLIVSTFCISKATIWACKNALK